MSVSTKIDLSRIYRALRFTPADMGEIANAAMAGMDQYVRADTAQMAGSAHVEGDEVVYSTDYAKHPFLNTRNRVTKTVHPKATARWDKAYEASGMKEVKEAVRAHVERG